MTDTRTSVAGALAAYDALPRTGPGTGLSEVITPNELDALRALLDAARAERAAPVPQLGTEHNGYAVRAVVAGEVAEGHLPHWYVAAEGEDGWPVWAVWTVVLEHGRLLWTCPAMHHMPSGDPLDRAGALAELAERAGLGNVPPF